MTHASLFSGIPQVALQIFKTINEYEKNEIKL